MRRKIKVIALLLVISMLGTFAMGCGTATPAASATPAATAAETPATSVEASAEASSDASAVPAGEKVTLKFMVTEHPAIIDWSTNSFIKWMEEKTNVHIEFEGIPMQGRAEKVNLVLASGNYPDVFFGLNFTAAQIEQYGVKEQLLMPLNDLLDKNCVEINKIWTNFPGSKEIVTQLDGNIYSMPNVNECYHCTLSSKMWINQVWLDNLGLKMPTTTDELYTVLKAFKEKDPNKNGKADEIPMAGAHADGWWDNYDRFLMNSFLYYDYDVKADTSFGLMLDGDKVTVPFYNEAPMKEGLKYLNKLYTEGLYYEGSFAQTNVQLTQLVENPGDAIVGVVGGGYGGMFSQLGGERYKMYRAMDPLKGPGGVQLTVHEPYGNVWANNFLLSKTCSNPEVAVKWGDFMYTFDATQRSYLGVEGVGWRPAKEGEVGINGKPALYFQLTPWQEVDPQNDHIAQQCIDYRPIDYRLGMAYDEKTDMYSADGLEKLLQVVSESYMKYAATKNKLLPVKYTTAENEQLMLSKTELGKTLKEQMTGFMTGKLNIDTDYAAFVETLKTQGMDKLIEVTQNAYNTQFKK